MAQHVVAEPPADQRDAQPDRVEQEIQRVLPVQAGTLTVTPRPEPVADERDRRRHHRRDRLGRQPGHEGQADVEQTEINEESDAADHPELPQLMYEMPETLDVRP